MQTLKKDGEFKGLVADIKPLRFKKIVSCGVLFLVSRTNYLDIQNFKIFQNIPNNSSAIEEVELSPLLA